ncbi:MAG: helix-turn-helix domain-containing protein [Candidatus Dormibacteraceae bacterium]
MDQERCLVEAVVLGRQRPSQLARTHGISRSWLCELLGRFREGGYPALEPRSRRPHGCSHQVGTEVQAAVLQLRQDLLTAGDDAGPQTIAHLQRRVERVPSFSTIWRILKRHRSHPSPTNAPPPPSSVLRPTSPTRCGRPTPPPGSWPTPARARS